MNIIFFMTAAIGLTLLIVESKIFESFRNRMDDLSSQNVTLTLVVKLLFLSIKNLFSNILDINFLIKKINYMISCYQCCGFWTGLFMGITLLSWNPFIIFAAGCSGSFLSYLSSYVIDALTVKISNNNV